METMPSIISSQPKGPFTQVEIDEVVRRFKSGQSTHKISVQMARGQRAITNHLIRLGIMEKPVIQDNPLSFLQCLKGLLLSPVRFDLVAFIFPVLLFCPEYYSILLVSAALKLLAVVAVIFLVCTVWIRP